MTHYKLDPKHCLYINFEDARLIGNLDTGLLDGLLTYFRNQFSKDVPLYFFLDEIQNVANWEKWMHTQLERPANNYFVVTGSNSALLSGELGSSLAGRNIVQELFPFNYSEYRLSKSTEHGNSDAKSNITNFLKTGGFPLAQTYHNPTELLQQYFNDIIEKDVRARLNSPNSTPIKRVVKMLFESIGSELSLRKIAGNLGISVDTVQSYIDACELAYLVYKCPFFSYSERKRAPRNIKYYPVDTGLRRAIATQTGLDLGKDLEAAAYLNLRQRKKNIFYWKGKGEVDFVVQSNNSLVPIQVSMESPHERHFQAIEEFFAHFPQAEEPIYVGPNDLINDFTCFDEI